MFISPPNKLPHYLEPNTKVTRNQNHSKNTYLLDFQRTQQKKKGLTEYPRITKYTSTNKHKRQTWYSELRQKNLRENSGKCNWEKKCKEEREQFFTLERCPFGMKMITMRVMDEMTWEKVGFRILGHSDEAW